MVCLLNVPIVPDQVIIQNSGHWLIFLDSMENYVKAADSHVQAADCSCSSVVTWSWRLSVVMATDNRPYRTCGF